jgi:hypothetical protein
MQIQSDKHPPLYHVRHQDFHGRQSPCVRWRQSCQKNYVLQTCDTRDYRFAIGPKFAYPG